MSPSLLKYQFRFWPITDLIAGSREGLLLMLNRKLVSGVQDAGRPFLTRSRHGHLPGFIADAFGTALRQGCILLSP